MARTPNPDLIGLGRGAPPAPADGRERKVGVVLNADTVARLDELCQRRRARRSALVREAVERLLDDG